MEKEIKKTISNILEGAGCETREIDYLYKVLINIAKKIEPVVNDKIELLKILNENVRLVLLKFDELQNKNYFLRTNDGLVHRF